MNFVALIGAILVQNLLISPSRTRRIWFHPHIETRGIHITLLSPYDSPYKSQQPSEPTEALYQSFLPLDRVRHTCLYTCFYTNLLWSNEHEPLAHNGVCNVLYDKSGTDAICKL